MDTPQPMQPSTPPQPSAPPPSSPVPEPIQMPQAPQSSGSKNMLMLLAALVMFVIAGILLYVFVLQPQTTLTPASTVPTPAVEVPAPTETPATDESEASSVDVNVDDTEVQQIQQDAAQL